MVPFILGRFVKRQAWGLLMTTPDESSAIVSENSLQRALRTVQLRLFLFPEVKSGKNLHWEHNVFWVPVEQLPLPTTVLHG